MKKELIEEIAARVNEKMQKSVCPITGQVASLRKVKDAYDNGYRAIMVKNGMIFTSEAKEFIKSKEIAVETIDV